MDLQSQASPILDKRHQIIPDLLATTSEIAFPFSINTPHGSPNTFDAREQCLKIIILPEVDVVL